METETCQELFQPTGGQFLVLVFGGKQQGQLPTKLTSWTRCAKELACSETTPTICTRSNSEPPATAGGALIPNRRRRGQHCSDQQYTPTVTPPTSGVVTKKVPNEPAILDGRDVANHLRNNIVDLQCTSKLSSRHYQKLIRISVGSRCRESDERELGVC